MQSDSTTAPPNTIASCYFVRVAFLMGLATIGSRVLGSLSLPHWDDFWHFVGKPFEGPVMAHWGSGMMVPYNLWTCLGYGAVWLAIDWRRRDGTLLHETTELLCRYALLGRMLGYAWVKVPATFWPAGLAIPSVASQYSMFGDATGGSLFWWWLGVAPLYVKFVAMSEIGSALLLIPKRTAPLGAFLCAFLLLSIGVMMGNFGQSRVINTVPMTAFSVAALLLWQYRNRFIDFFIRDRDLVLPARRFVWPKAWMVPVLVVLGMAYGVRELYILRDATTTGFSVTRAIPFEFTFYRTPLDGYYRVLRFSRAHSSSPATEWHHVMLNRCTAVARTVDDHFVYFLVSRDSAAPSPTPRCDALGDRYDGHKLQWLGRDAATGEPTRTDTLRYVAVGTRDVALTGRLAGDSVDIRLERIPDERYPFFNPRWATVLRDDATPKGRIGFQR